MPTRLRKLALTAHVVASAGWIGAALGYVALAATALTSADVETVRSVYVAMRVSVWWVIVPLSIAALATGLVSSLTTTWGLTRHYWVLIKLALTVLATGMLVLYTGSIDQAAHQAASGATLQQLRQPTHLIHSGVGTLVLLVATVLAVYKPRGRLRH